MGEPVLLGVVGAVVGLLAGRGLNVLAHRVVVRRPDAAKLLPGTTTTRRVAVPGPWVELGTAALAALVLARFGLVPLLPAWLWLAGCAVVLVVIDLQHHLLPNRVLLPTGVVGLVALAVVAAATGDWSALVRGVLAALSLSAGLFALAAVNPSGLGLGDVKLGLVLGLYLGWLSWSAVLTGVFLGFVVQGLVAMVLLAARRAGRDTQLAFGPALLAGALVVGLLAA
ncbi:leader peptidase (prepilin peptidase) / N-methyltransferase [Klenkia soli]|uniref:Leader peptidase (Prepilin peptidase) / N-methyltransferase n=1 Tax=Klenkia soli TaxID=1052260 RepID=A0A1H0T1Q6_9ACTN|nr:A24 family peptidase [Klenkia soli]SDP47640.1 leader peptidase (prepilin peptidase) / N-methyltransferase [Klenkia soli]